MAAPFLTSRTSRGAAKLRDASSSVAPVASGYERFLTGGILSLVMPVTLLAIVLGAWWLAVRRGGLKQSAPQEGDGGSTEGRGP